jgi:hypothetical protein
MERSGNALDSEIQELAWHKNGYKFSVTGSPSLLNRFCVEKLNVLDYCLPIVKLEYCYGIQRKKASSLYEA